MPDSYKRTKEQKSQEKSGYGSKGHNYNYGVTNGNYLP